MNYKNERILIMTRNLQDPVNQKVHFTRTATKDLVTGKVSYSDWTPMKGIWEKYEAPNIAGFIANPKEIPEQEVNPNTQSTSVNIMYTATSAGITINFIDKDNNKNVVDSVTLTGLVGETPNLTQANEKVNELTTMGYNVSTPILPNGTLFTGNLQIFNIEVTHKIKQGINEQDPEGVGGLGRDVTRTINFVTNN